MDSETLWSLLVGGVISLVGSLAVAYWFHGIAGRDLRNETDRLTEQNKLAARQIDILTKVVEDPATTRVRRDETGRAIGNVFDATSSATQGQIAHARAHVSGSDTLTKGAPAPKDGATQDEPS